MLQCSRCAKRTIARQTIVRAFLRRCGSIAKSSGWRGGRRAQVVQEVLLWSRAPMEVRRLCARKEELFRALRGDCPPATPLGFANLLTMLAKNDVCPPPPPPPNSPPGPIATAVCPASESSYCCTSCVCVGEEGRGGGGWGDLLSTLVSIDRQIA